MSKISVIIPILNEADYIGNLLQHMLDNSTNENISEIIVVDGGSTDGSLEIINRFVSSSLPDGKAGAVEGSQIDPETTLRQAQYDSSGLENQTKVILVDSPKGRARQMNLGAQNTSGTIFYFLHADSLPPKGFDQLIINEVENGNKAGCFRMQFNSNHWWLRLASWLTQFRWRACRGGDQSQFISKVLFNEIGGYDESYIIYEDNILINELYARNEFVVINKKLRTSARCYKRNGIWKLQYHFWVIYVKKWFGASAEELYAYYKKHVR